MRGLVFLTSFIWMCLVTMPLNCIGQFDQRHQVFLLGETHLDGFKSRLTNPGFRSYWDSVVSVRNAVIDSIIYDNPTVCILWEAPVSFEFYVGQYLNSGQWNANFIPGNVYDKIWIEHLREVVEQPRVVRTIDFENREFSRYTSGALIGSLLDFEDRYSWFNRDKYYLDSLISKLSSEELRKYLNELAAIHFNAGSGHARKLYRFLRQNQYVIASSKVLSSNINHIYIKRLICSYIIGFKLGYWSSKRLQVRDQNFYDEIVSMDSEVLFICGMSHAVPNEFINRNVFQLLTENNWPVKVRIVD